MDTEVTTKALYVHTSDRGTFKTCRQKWDFSSPLRLNLEPIRPQAPLWFGTGIHKALAAYYDPSTPRKFALAYESWADYFNTEKARFIKENGDLWIEQEEAFEEHNKLGIGMLQHYCESYAPEHDDFDVIWVEKTYKVLLGFLHHGEFWHSHDYSRSNSVPVYYSFKPDALVKDYDGRYWLNEYKTAARMDDNMEWLAIDAQVGSYIWGIQLVDSPHMQDDSFIIEGVNHITLRKKVPQPLRVLNNGEFSTNKSQDTTYEIALQALKSHYGETIPDKYKDLLHILQEKGNNFFRRAQVRRNQNEIAILGGTILAEAKEMVNPNVHITRNPGRYTCGFCPFIAPCIAKYEGSDWEFILAGNYRSRPQEEGTG